MKKLLSLALLSTLTLTACSSATFADNIGTPVSDAEKNFLELGSQTFNRQDVYNLLNQKQGVSNVQYLFKEAIVLDGAN